MKLFQIEEPQSLNKTTETAVGIDLGTTNSLVCYIDETNKPQIFTDESGNKLHPSIVGIDEQGKIFVSHEASTKNIKKIYSFKRLMGQTRDKIKGDVLFQHNEFDTQSAVPKIKLGENYYYPTQLSSFILKHLKELAETNLGKPVTKAVITVPAYFDDNARSATLDAAKLAGLEVLRLVNEPTAAALAFDLDHKKEGIFLVYDLGGGTFDATLLKIEKGIFQVLATNGDINLGGDDFDHMIADYVIAKQNLMLTPCEYSNLIMLSKQIKQDLTDCTSTNLEFKNTRTFFDNDIIESILAEPINNTISIVDRVLADAKIRSEQVNEIVLVGGSTRLKIVKSYLQKAFNKDPLDKTNPDEAVAIGAGLLARNLTRGSDQLLLDVNPLSLGIELMGGLVEKIIPRNSPIPTAITRQFTTYEDGQTAIKLSILQGERELAKDCRLLATIIIRNLKPMVAGLARINVTFTLDADGILTVNAADELSGVKQELQIKPSYGISEQEIEQMLKDSIANREADFRQMVFHQSLFEAEELIHSLRKIYNNDTDIFTPEDTDRLEGFIAQLEVIKLSQDNEELKKLLSTIKIYSDIVAQKQVAKYIKSSLAGRKLEEIASRYKKT